MDTLDPQTPGRDLVLPVVVEFTQVPKSLGITITNKR